MVAERGKKSKVAAPAEEDSDPIDSELVLSIEKLQEVQDELEKYVLLKVQVIYNHKPARYFGMRISICLTISNKSMAAFPGKRIHEDSDEEDPVHHAELSAKIKKVRDVQNELKKVNEDASDKVLEIEQKYNEIRRPVYVQRSEIIKTIPDFWLTAFLSHPALGDLLNEEDQKIFKYLDSLDVEDFKDVKSGYSITFNFKQNPYFEDTKLTKTFIFLDEGTTRITGTAIKWKEGMGAANGGSHEKKGNKRPASDDSFFSWFSETQQKDTFEVEGLNDEVAEIIKEDLWPNPLKYFNNEADEEDSEGEEEDEEGKGDDDEEDDDEDGNEEDDP